MPQMFQVLREHAVGMLTAGMFTRAVAREYNVNFSTISRLQRHFRDFGSTTNQPQLHITCNHASPGPPHQASSLAESTRPATLSADETVGLNN